MSIALLQIAATVFLFKFPTSGVFGIWAGFGATITSAYHWLRVRDDKEHDKC